MENTSSSDPIDRRGFLKCMAWVGTGVLFTVSGGILSSRNLSQFAEDATGPAVGELSFVQISDSHLGFSKDANKDVVATFQQAIDRIKSLPQPPAFVVHTGDITHLSKPAEFDAAQQILNGAGFSQVYTVPGEHDVIGDDGKTYRERFARGTKGNGWYSFDLQGVHFIALVNVLNLKSSGMGFLGAEQLEWLEDDVRWLSSSTPIVVFAHMPLWTIYPEWGWGTDDSAQALSYLKRFGSVTVLNGHIHQTLQKVEGNIRFHTAMSTAYPQPAPGAAPSPGPLKVPAERLRSLLGVREVRYTEGSGPLAVVDTSLASGNRKETL